MDINFVLSCRAECGCHQAENPHANLMKTQHPFSARGFTLVELLVVIAIIAVLASAGFAVGNKAFQQARKAMALRVCTGIELGVNNFFTEYGSLPTTETVEENMVDGMVTDDDGPGLNLVRTLMDDEVIEPIMNVKGIKFLEVKEGKAKKDGLMYAETDTKPRILGLYDPWGGPYRVSLDVNYDEVIEVQPKASGSKKKTLNGRRVVAWSNGADGAEDGSTGKVTDDVTTW